MSVMSDRCTQGRGVVRIALLAAVTIAVWVAIGGARALAAGLPAIGYQQAFAVTESATPEAEIEPHGLQTTCAVEYVGEAAFQSSGWGEAKTQSCATGLGSGNGVVTGFARIEGLSIDSAYHFRFLATNEAGSTTGPEGTFVTFGIKLFSFQVLDSGEGNAVTQAGAHPYEQVTHIVFKTNPGRIPEGSGFQGVSEMATLKDVKVELPAGLVGSPAATPRCSRLASEEFKCRPEAQVGTIEIESGENESLGLHPLFNLVPPEGVAARFSARFSNFANAFIDASVRTGADYGVDADSLNITGLAPVKTITVRLWGVPAAATHTPERACINPEGGGYATGCASEAEVVKPFLSMPTSCLGPTNATLAVDAYQEPGAYVESTVQMPALTGCGQVSFAPTITTQPTSTTADSPTGLNVDLHVPQEENPEKTATADLKNAVVTFPAGMSVDPSSADGLEACSEAQVGFKHEFAELNPADEPGVETPQFTPGPAQCPEGSKLGTVEIDTPLLEHPLPGALYLATPHENPFGSLIAVYLTVYDPVSGVVIKLPGKVQANPQTGQLTTTFDQNPQLPFEDLRVDLFSGQRAALTTPLTCGSYATTTDLTPWTSPEGADATPSSNPFQIAEAPGGGACADSEGQAPNGPIFTAGTVSPIAGSYSPFVLKLSREDATQHFVALNVTLPPGLIGKIAGIEQCSQAAIEAAQRRTGEGEGALEQSSPSCPSGSEVGTVNVGAGSGAPYYVTGHAYFAGPYGGAPFSMVIVTPVIAGPFDLGTVVVRAALFIDPSTAQVTVKSDPFPTILDGIPLDIRDIAVDISRPDFTLNPTSCETMSVTGEESSTAGQTAGLSDRFQAGGCTTLPFHPSFQASTQGKTSRTNGASLDVKVGSGMDQANIAKVRVALPKALPSRQSTLNLACQAVVFDANPAACPAGSNVGTATALTPILANPLTGPAYLVSHGGAAFPDLEIVLQGEGITLILDGKTNIDEKTGITSSTFESVPDAPISTFQLSLPEGPHSILAAPGNKLCSEKLTMPTRLQGQNGAVIEQATKITVTGCAKPKTLTRAQKLAGALKACHKDKRKHKRATCEKQAHKRYGPVKKKKK